MKPTIAVLVALICFASGAHAQQGRGTIFGTVTDSSGAAVTGAKVSILNVDTNTATNTETNSQGYYTSPPLIVGNYQVVVAQAGFKKEVRSGVSLQVDQHAEIDLQLTVGAVGESVEVTAETPMVNTENASVGQVIENKRVQELPLNGRSAFALILLSPDVHSNAGPVQSGFADRGTSLSDWSINGGPNAVNNMLVDGMVASNSYYPDLNADLAVDAVQEFKVQSGSMSSEYGFTLGGVINVATRTGTNDYHGSLYEFVRNNIFDSRNTFAAAELPFRYNQYGLALGGPVLIPKLYNGKNRTFIFGNWEQYHYIKYSQSITSTPIAAQRNGDFSQLLDATGKLIPVYDPATTAVNPSGSGYIRQLFPGNIIPASRLDPVAQKINQFYPLPNLAPSNPYTNANNYLSSVSQTTTMQQYTTRVDHRFSDNDTFFARYTYFVNYTDNGTSSPWPNPAVRARYDNFETRNTAVSETHTFSPTMLNEIRVGIARQYFPFQAASYGQNWPQQLGFPASVPNTTVPTITSNGYTAFTTGTVGIRGALTWDATDIVTIVRGAHSIKLGIEYRLLFGNNYQTASPSGSFTFTPTLTGNPQAQSGTGSAYADFLLGDPSTATVGTYVGESEKGYSLSGFVQDDWRVSAKLNVNLGLRYDYQQPPYERNCGTSNFNPYVVDPNTGLPGRLQFACKDYGKTFLDSDYKNFGPRVGFAYDLRGNGRTVIRGGYAIFYPSIFNLTYFGNTSGFAATNTTYNPPGGNSNLPALVLSQGFPTPPIQPLGSALGPSAFLGQSVSYDQPNQKTPMSQQWDFSVQKQLPGNWVVDATYSANHGTHLVAGNYPLDSLNPQYLSLGNALQNPVPNPYAGKVPGSLGAATITQQQSLLPFPYYSAIAARNPHLGNSIYHAGLLSIQKRFSQGLTLLASYTKAKLISDSVAAPIGFGAVEQVTNNGYQNGQYDRALERSVDPTDVPQRLAISGVYELPFGKGRPIAIQNNVINAIFGGWQAQTIITLQKGLPVLITGASNNLATRPNSTGQSAQLSNPTAAEWFNTAVFVNPPNYTYGNVGRALPDVRNPGFFNTDFSLIKNTKIGERWNLQLRGEAFNLDNHVNLGYPNVTFVPGPNGQNVSSTFGTITSARDARSIQIGAKLLF
ncbi:MAG TPA: carboxypeptidase regulatory-like domain-containing protein [Bryobacteraceae bacterium]|nr:carboxypeptidase regulatory-like domain-containing protein [Bryobacteraceae bacterium]